MSVSSSRGTLVASGKQLKISWEQTKQFWQDSKSRDFEERYLLPLFQELDRSGSLLEELDRALYQIRKDCE